MAILASINDLNASEKAVILQLWACPDCLQTVRDTYLQYYNIDTADLLVIRELRGRFDLHGCHPFNMLPILHQEFQG